MLHEEGPPRLEPDDQIGTLSSLLILRLDSRRRLEGISPNPAADGPQNLSVRAEKERQRFGEMVFPPRAGAIMQSTVVIEAAADLFVMIDEQIRTRATSKGLGLSTSTLPLAVTLCLRAVRRGLPLVSAFLAGSEPDGFPTSRYTSRGNTHTPQ